MFQLPLCTCSTLSVVAVTNSFLLNSAQYWLCLWSPMYSSLISCPLEWIPSQNPCKLLHRCRSTPFQGNGLRDADSDMWTCGWVGGEVSVAFGRWRCGLASSSRNADSTLGLDLRLGLGLERRWIVDSRRCRAAKPGRDVNEHLLEEEKPTEGGMA